MLKAAVSALRPRRSQLFLPLRVWIRTWSKGKLSPSSPPEVEEDTITENISSAGCYFLLGEEPEIGSRVELEIKMEPKPGGKPGSKVICRGRIVRTEKETESGKTGVGCAFERYQIIPPSRKS